MIEAPQPRNGKSNWWKEVISVLRNGWLTTAIVVEVLGLLAAFATIPGLPLPTALMLSVTGILSAGGVLIVTVYFMLQYNRRPLNYIQAGEVSNMLSPYLRSELAQDGFVPKSELSEFVQGFGLFWQWQYQKSIVELGRAIDKLRSQPGFVIVAQSGTPEGPGARFARSIWYARGPRKWLPRVRLWANPWASLVKNYQKNTTSWGRYLATLSKCLCFIRVPTGPSGT